MNDNKTFDLDHVGHELSENVHFGVFDYSDKTNYDYYFRQLIMLETFNGVTIEFQVGPYKVMLPQEWSIILGDPETGDVELIPINEINTRFSHVFSFNPIRGSLHKFLPLKPINVFTDTCWVGPRLAFHNFLLVPLHSGPNPDCIFIINEKDQKKLGPLELDMLI